MRKLTLRLLLSLVIFPLLSASPFLQSADSQTAWFKKVIARDTFTGKVIGVSDGDTISVMREGRAVKVRLHGIASM
jgi:endonuclease YncB( thermonuclease family)